MKRRDSSSSAQPWPLTTVARIALVFLIASAALHVSARPPQFTYKPPGELTPGSGNGRRDSTEYAPGVRFPIERSPAYANSQVWGVGGMKGPTGSSCDPPNFQYPWWDNYCETRDKTKKYLAPLCPDSYGHLGQDIRAVTCKKSVHPAVAAVDGFISKTGPYSVYLTFEDGTIFEYLHMDNLEVRFGQHVKKAQRLGRVSNVFGGELTTVHLHFGIQQAVAPYGFTFVPPYMSLVKAYEQLP